MEKIRIKSTPLFKQVAAVIGEERAQIELAKVCHDSVSSRIRINFALPLGSAFCWSSSPQKYDFWKRLDDGVGKCKN